MTFSRPLRMSWLIVGIHPFQNDRRLDDAGGGRKNRVLSRKEARIILGKLSLSSESEALNGAWLAGRRRACCNPVRSRNRMTLVDCVGLGINGIIGTGIFLLPAKVYRSAEGLSWAAWLAIGSVCLLVGLCFVDWQRLSFSPPAGVTRVEALKLGGFGALFACTGFEYVPVTAGETDNPRRNVPLALFLALSGSIFLYVLVQIVFMGTHPTPGAADKPLAEAAGAFAGPWAGGFVAVGSVISSFGYLTAVALVTPRYLSSLGENGELPPVFARTNARHGTPSVAIVVTAMACAALAAFADFDRLSDLNNAAVFAQYVPTCLAVLVLRRTKGPSTLTLPLGPAIPLLATLGCVLFLNGIKRDDVIFSLATLAVGIALHAAWRAFGRRPVLETP